MSEQDKVQSDDNDEPYPTQQNASHDNVQHRHRPHHILSVHIFSRYSIQILIIIS